MSFITFLMKAYEKMLSDVNDAHVTNKNSENVILGTIIDLEITAKVNRKDASIRYLNESAETVLVKAVRLIPKAFANTAQYTNYGNKDIIIDHEVRPIIHIVNKEHASLNLPSHNIVSPSKPLFNDTSKQTIFMLASYQKLGDCTDIQDQITPSYVGIMICSKVVNEKSLRFSSLEI